MSTLFKVKRCPFCNSHNLVMEASAAAFSLHCLGCGTFGPNGYTRQGAVLMWNGTHRHQNPDALVRNRKSNHHDLKEVEL